MLLSDFLQVLEQLLPAATAMQGDRLGLQVQSGRTEIQSVLCCLDCTEDVIDEAIRIGADSVLSFHPLIFGSLYSITDDLRVGRCVQKVIKHDICLISAHTNFDAHPQGTNQALANQLGLEVESLLVPDRTFPSHGMGVVCSAHSMSFQDLLYRVRKECSPVLRHSSWTPPSITRVAIVSGSGSSYLQQAIEARAEVFITADVKYHTFFEAEGRIAIIDPGHFEMEQFVPRAMASVLSDAMAGLPDAPALTQTQCNTNPIRYCF